jgi:protein involved in polysaccharide export with SLBB domain
MTNRLTDQWKLPVCIALMLSACLLSPLMPTASLLAQDLPTSDRHKGSDRTAAQEQKPELNTGTLEMAVDDSLYIVGPYDLLVLALYAEGSYVYQIAVTSSGTIVIPGMGEIPAAGLSLAALRSNVQALVNRNFKRAQVKLSLLHARQIKVSVTGAVQRQCVVTLPASSRVSEALQLAGGPIRDTTAMRGIVVRRSDGIQLKGDLTSFYRLGDTRDNPFLMGGDVVYFPRIDERVGVFGEVNYEGHMDFVPGDRLFDCIRMAGGFRSAVYLDSIEIVRYEPDHVTTKTFYLNLTGYPDDDQANILMQSEDLVLVRAIPNFHHQRLVVITGKVKRPGTYPILYGKTRLSQVIERAGGFTEEASLEEATVTRRHNENERDLEFERLSKVQAADMREDEYEYFKARSRERVGQMSVNFKKLFLEHDLSEDIILQENDIIDIPIQKNYVRVIGRVNNPGNVIFHKEWKWDDYIEYCGGFGWRANESDVRVIKSRTGELMDAEKTSSYELEPGDTVWVPEETKTKFWEVAFTTLGVLSQIAGIVGIVIAVSR